jgi:opacity protein-like surface antigen
MKFKIFILVILLVAYCGSAHAGVLFGINGDYSKFVDANKGDWGIGARFLFGGNLHLITSFDYYFTNRLENLKFYEINGNLAYVWPTEVVRPYIGAGVGVSRQSFDTPLFSSDETKAGFNLLGGLRFGHGPVQPFAEFRYIFQKSGIIFSGNRFVVSGGLLF